MNSGRPRWRIRISTLMLLVLVAALGVALIVGPRKRLAAEAEKMRAENEARLAAAEAWAARVTAEHTREQVEVRLHKELDAAKRAGRRGE